jgi:type I restriction enzyme S subunit
LEGFTCDKAWLYWTLKGLTFYVEAEAHGIIGLVHITKGKLGTIAIPVIERTEQQAITAFLDRETAKIDALVEKKRRLIELLKEKRAALISHAVTKGLNPDVPMKDSGTHWAGRLPTHWKECSLKYLATVDTGGTPDRNRPEYWNGDIPWVKTGEVNYDRIKGTAEHITTDGLRNSAAKIADPGTMLMALYGEGVTRGRVAILGIRAAYNQACAGIKFRKRLMLSGYARFWFMSAYEHIRDNGNETTQMNLSCGAIRNFKLPVPPLKEQQRITEFLDGESEKFDGLVAKVEAAIDRLLEYRTALISAAVTGKIDVRNISGGRPDRKQ